MYTKQTGRAREAKGTVQSVDEVEVMNRDVKISTGKARYYSRVAVLLRSINKLFEVYFHAWETRQVYMLIHALARCMSDHGPVCHDMIKFA